MRLIYFFTFDYSLETLNNSGSLDREIKYFKHLNNTYGYSFFLVTYGDENDLNVLDEYDFIKVLPLYSVFKRWEGKLLRYASSFFYAFKIKKIVGEFEIIKQNQLLGSWVSIIFKIITQKKLFIRTGYDMYTFSKLDKKPFHITFLYYALTKFSLYFSDIYSVTSNEDLKILNKINKNKKIELIPNWVEDLNFKDFNLRSSVKILCVGRLEYQKNYSYLFSSLVGKDVEVDIYGDGHLLDELKKLATNLNLRVNFLGTLKYQELKNIYQQYKIFVSTSLFEGNPKSTLEAMSAGCVPVVSKIPNNVEIIDNKKNGILFNYEDNLGELIESLFQDVDNLSKISFQSHANILKKNGIDVIANMDNTVMQKL
jgi:glycosyltransferase involved in cell wall biosynthesis